ncbi:hypothetical protein CBR_g13058 [Chara braunii]|uniref:Uncharacterized protein n=1 Tax=Chara braunii TaxID=69332 RepID=A0A388KTL9_CHABU|nr:hypothetical protein CBR_g13058 [Chara braunii]|eukprot:GBG73338.1 hypothetical protein CBR_g13058 [Chara braunii]
MGLGRVDFLEGLVVGSSREGISNAVVEGMANGECELGKEVEPSSWAWGDVFLGEDGRNDGVVSADGEVLPVEARAPDCEGVNHSEEFLLVGGIIHLRGKELLACEGDGVFVGWSLGYSSNGELGGISGDMEMASGVDDLEDRGRGDGLLEEVKNVLAVIAPIEGLVPACEFVEGVRDLEKVANEWAVIVGKAEEGTELEEGLGRGVLDEGCDLRGVHTDAFSGDNVAKVFDARSGKRTFVELGVEFLLLKDREDLANVLKPVEERPALRIQASMMKLSVAPISRRARNFTVHAPRGTEINLSWNYAVPAQAKEIMVLRRHCSKPNLTSRSCRAYSSTRSEKVVEKGLGMRVEEWVRIGSSTDGIANVVRRGANGVDCVAWGSSDGIEKVGPLEEVVTWSSRGATVDDFGHPPFGGIAEEAGSDNGKPVDKGHVVELERVLELGKEEENVLVGKAGEGHDVSGSKGTGDFPFAENDPGEV